VRADAQPTKRQRRRTSCATSPTQPCRAI
jgi:hypothetical protein